MLFDDEWIAGVSTIKFFLESLCCIDLRLMCVFVCSMLMISEEWQVSSPGFITSSWCKVGSCIWIIQPPSMQAELQLWCSQIEMCSQSKDYVIRTVRVLLLCQEHGTSMFADRNEFSHHKTFIRKCESLLLCALVFTDRNEFLHQKAFQQTARSFSFCLLL